MSDRKATILDRTWLDLHGDELASRLVGPWATRQRWFGDKSRVVTGVTTPFAQPIVESASLFLLTILEFAFESGPSARYFIPLSAPGASGSSASIGSCGGISFSDAITDEWFLRWLGTSAAEHASATAEEGSTTWHGVGDGISGLSDPNVTIRPLTVEQSNSSVLYGEHTLVKLLRKLQPGQNLEIEISRYLTTRTSFRNAPRLQGWWTVEVGGEEIALAVAQSFEKSDGDGWRYACKAMGSVTDLFSATAVRLGERTAELHLALGADVGLPDFAPEPIGPDDVDTWSRELSDNIGKAEEAIRATLFTGDGRTRDLKIAFLDAADRLSQQTRGFEGLLGCAKIRVHGDYHLGQTLRTADGDWVILDFEGEPGRPLAQRRAKTSPLKDVAGMLRSFGYAQASIQRKIFGGGPDALSADVQFLPRERAARDAFLTAYIATARAGRQTFLPAKSEDLSQAIAAWEIDKAFYEILYELDNRPDWVWLPLSAVMRYA